MKTDKERSAEGARKFHYGTARMIQLEKEARQAQRKKSQEAFARSQVKP